MLEKMLDGGISEKELCAAELMVRIAHDLIESDVMLKKLEDVRCGSEGNPSDRMNPK